MSNIHYTDVEHTFFSYLHNVLRKAYVRWCFQKLTVKIIILVTHRSENLVFLLSKFITFKLELFNKTQHNNSNNFRQEFTFTARTFVEKHNDILVIWKKLRQQRFCSEMYLQKSPRMLLTQYINNSKGRNQLKIPTRKIGKLKYFCKLKIENPKATTILLYQEFLQDESLEYLVHNQEILLHCEHDF